MDKGFLNRWSQRKAEHADNTECAEQACQQQHSQQEKPVIISETDSDITEKEELGTDTARSAGDFPEKLVGDSIENPAGDEQHVSLASLLASEAEAAVKKAALRRLFFSGAFHQVDGLNDYDQDFASVKPLASDVIASLRGWVNDLQDSDETDSRTVNADEGGTELANTELANAAYESEKAGYPDSEENSEAEAPSPECLGKG